jgi:integrase/recombinase XerD
LDTDLPGKEHAISYVGHKHRCNHRPGTIRGNVQAIESFLVLIQQAGKDHLEQLSRRDLEAFVEHDQDRGLKASTIRTRLAYVYAFVGFLAETGVVSSDLLARKLRLRAPEALPRAMAPGDVRRLVSAKGTVRDRAMVLLLLRTGMRIGELLGTRLCDVNVREKKIAIFEAEKNQVGRVVYFSDDAGDALKLWLKQRDEHKQFIFYARGRDTLTYTGARMRFKKHLEEAGLAGKGYSLHCLRHTFASELLNAGMRLECLQQLLGHANLEETRRYARLTDKSREAEYFRAMSIIERGEIDGHYRLDCELQKILEKKELLPAHPEELPQCP